MSHAPGDASGPLATLPHYQAQTPERSADSVWELTPEGLAPRAVAAFLCHALTPGESLFRDVRRVPVAVPRVRRAAVPEMSTLETDGSSGAHPCGGMPSPASSPHTSVEVDRPTRALPLAGAGAGETASLRVEEDPLAEALLSALSGTVGRHVATGVRDVSLSGGVDSATLCALAARHAPGRVRAWTMDVHFADATERRNARTMARLSGVELVDVPIPDAVLPDLFEAAVLSNETALINARAVASFAFYREARRLGASTMLSGAGADEVLLGNPDALAGARARVEEDRRLARDVLRPGAVISNPEALAGARARVEKDRRLARVRPGAVVNLGTTPWSLSGSDAEASEEVRHAAWVLRELVLPPELRGASAHGLTVRTPYLDPSFADMALALPASLLVHDGTGKWLFRHAVRTLVPDEVRLARKTPRYAQTALSSPVRERWLELYRAWLAPSRLEPLEVIAPDSVLTLLERYTRLPPDAPEAAGMDRLLMRLVSLAMLHARCLDRTPCPES